MQEGLKATITCQYLILSLKLIILHILLQKYLLSGILANVSTAQP